MQRRVACRRCGTRVAGSADGENTTAMSVSRATLAMASWIGPPPTPVVRVLGRFVVLSCIADLVDLLQQETTGLHDVDQIPRGLARKERLAGRLDRPERYRLSAIRQTLENPSRSNEAGGDGRRRDQASHERSPGRKRGFRGDPLAGKRCRHGCRDHESDTQSRNKPPCVRADFVPCRGHVSLGFLDQRADPLADDGDEHEHHRPKHRHARPRKGEWLFGSLSRAGRRGLARVQGLCVPK
jgi:hypothetical protein